MNKNIISKIIVLIITFAVIACISTSAYADSILDLNSIAGDSTTDEEIPDITPPKQEQTTPEETTPEETTPEETTPEETTPDITPNTNNTSTYEESNIPYAGPADTLLMIAAFIVCAIIGIYTFIKLSAYSNI